MTENDRSVQKALLRFKIISAYLAENPPRGQRRAMLEHLSNKTWMLENGEIVACQSRHHPLLDTALSKRRV